LPGVRYQDDLGIHSAAVSFTVPVRRAPCVLRINFRLLSGGRERPVDRIRMTVSNGSARADPIFLCYPGCREIGTERYVIRECGLLNAV
jgi:hypothetical protein